ncbi:MAG: helix-hairpin-helix domain-containing protein [Bacillota bacterium]|nr:helix-hairpin-helix domain-containing protein [Bacillota bacterium]
MKRIKIYYISVAIITAIFAAAIIFINNSDSLFGYTFVHNESVSDADAQKDYRININTAGVDELDMIDGIGEATAKEIIEYREEYGNFKNIEDIKNVKGIKDKTFDKIKRYIKTN